MIAGDMIQKVLKQPWAVDCNVLTGLVREAAKCVRGEQSAFEFSDVQAARARRAEPRSTGSGGVGVIQIHGILQHRSSPLDALLGTVGTTEISAELRAALADDSVASILLDIDSPGGSVAGVMELADEIYAARTKKPIIAIANSLAASAAYWLGSSASEFVMAPSAQVGSIGVFSAHEDYSKALDEAGVNTTLIYAGQYKTEASPYAPLSKDAANHMQSLVDDYYGAFTRSVARGRNTNVTAVRGGMGQGRVLGASEALAANMVDSVMTFGQALSLAQRRVTQPRPQRASARAEPVGNWRVAAARRELELQSLAG